MNKISKTQFWLVAIWLIIVVTMFLTENPVWS
jgi:hypothetical protein